MKLTWQEAFSTKRLGSDRETQDARSAFERDYDRIIFSSAFRRLQNKTQVFPLPKHVLVHNRLSHSLEVTSVGRSLGAIVGGQLADLPGLKTSAAAQDFYRNNLRTVISTACLAHDLGNPAFGHSGEEAISKYFIDRAGDRAFRDKFTEAEYRDLTHFEGNANAFRLLTRQFKGRLPGGYQLTLSSLAALLKYPCASTAVDKSQGKHRSKYGFFQSDLQTFNELTAGLGLQPESEQPLAFRRHPFVHLTEAADDICYSIIDYEDAHRLGILSFEETKKDLLELIKTNPHEDFGRLDRNLENLRNDNNEAIAYLRSKAISYLVRCCAEVFMQNQETILAGGFAEALLGKVGAVAAPLSKIQKKSVGRIYNHESVMKIELAGFKIMSGLIEDLVEAALTEQGQRRKRHQKILALIPPQFRFEEGETPYEKTMAVLDYVSGMTDNYALELYRNLRGISVPEF